MRLRLEGPYIDKSKPLHPSLLLSEKIDTLEVGGRGEQKKAFLYELSGQTLIAIIDSLKKEKGQNYHGASLSPLLTRRGSADPGVQKDPPASNGHRLRLLEGSVVTPDRDQARQQGVR